MNRDAGHVVAIHDAPEDGWFSFPPLHLEEVGGKSIVSSKTSSPVCSRQETQERRENYLSDVRDGSRRRVGRSRDRATSGREEKASRLRLYFREGPPRVAIKLPREEKKERLRRYFFFLNGISITILL